MERELNIIEWNEEFNWKETQNEQVYKDFYGQWSEEDEGYKEFLKQSKEMVSIVNQLKEGGKVDLKNNFVFFHNCFSIARPYYDDFRIAEVKTRKVYFTIKCNCKGSSKFEVLGRYNLEDEFSIDPLFECKTPEELINWLNSK